MPNVGQRKFANNHTAEVNVLDFIDVCAKVAVNVFVVRVKIRQECKGSKHPRLKNKYCTVLGVV